MANVKANYNKAGKIISYRFYAYCGMDETTGKKQQITKTVPAPAGLTPAKALKRMQVDADNWENEIRKGNAPYVRFSFKYFIEEQFIPVHVCKGHSPSTVSFYKDICSKLVERFGNKPLDGIRSIDIERYLVDLTKETYKRGKNGKEQTYKATYIDHFRTVLAVAFGFAEKHGIIERNPMRFVSSVKAERTEVDFLTTEEALKFLDCLHKDATLYWQTAMNLFIRTGIRRGELAGLKWMDIDEINSTLNVCRDVINNDETGRKNVVKETKSAHSDRVLPIDPVMMKMLKAWRAEQSEQYGLKLMPSAFIFGTVSIVDNAKKQKQREELYVKVWEKPVSQVAKELGISDNALRKRCINLDVPLPDRGYWAKLKAGQAFNKPELSEMESDSDVVDPYSPIRPDSITQWLSRFNKKHGLRNISPHDLRHTCATLLLSNGATVKETQMIMGHADASTTLKFYVGTDMNALKSASDRLSQALTIGNKESAI